MHHQCVGVGVYPLQFSLTPMIIIGAVDDSSAATTLPPALDHPPRCSSSRANHALHMQFLAAHQYRHVQAGTIDNPSRCCSTSSGGGSAHRWCRLTPSKPSGDATQPADVVIFIKTEAGGVYRPRACLTLLQPRSRKCVLGCHTHTPIIFAIIVVVVVHKERIGANQQQRHVAR